MLVNKDNNEQLAALELLFLKLQSLADSIIQCENSNSKQEHYIDEYCHVLEAMRSKFNLLNNYFAAISCQFVYGNLLAIRENKAPVSIAVKRMLIEWPPVIEFILQNQKSESQEAKLITILSSTSWNMPFRHSQLKLFKKRLRQFKNIQQNIQPNQNSASVQISSHSDEVAFDEFSDDLPVSQNDNNEFSSITDANEKSISNISEDFDELCTSHDNDDTENMSLEELMALAESEQEEYKDDEKVTFDNNLEQKQLVEDDVDSNLTSAIQNETTNINSNDSFESDVKLDELMNFDIEENIEVEGQPHTNVVLDSYFLSIKDILGEIEHALSRWNELAEMEINNVTEKCLLCAASAKDVQLEGSSWYFENLAEWLCRHNYTEAEIQTKTAFDFSYYYCFINEKSEESILSLFQYLIEIEFNQLDSTLIEESSALFCEEMLQEELRENKDREYKSVDNDDVNIEIPSDAQVTLVDMFLQEAPMHVEELTHHLEAFTKSNSDLSHLISAQRCVHTLKGAAATIGINGLVNIAHEFEDILGFLADEQSVFPQKVVDFIFRVADKLAEICEYLCENGRLPDYLLLTLQSLTDISFYRSKEMPTMELISKQQDKFNLFLQEGNNNNQSVLAATDENDEEKRKEVTDTTDNSKSLLKSESDNKSNKKSGSVIRVAKEELEKILKNVGENTILQGQIEDEYGQIKRNFTELDSLTEKIQRTIFQFENYIDLQVTSRNRGRYSANETRENSGADEFDPLEVNRMDELHTYLNQIVESVSDLREVKGQTKNRLSSMEMLFQRQVSSAKVMESDIMATRMVPVNSIVPRLERCIRQVSRLLNKNINLNIIGQSISIDVDVLNVLTDPLMHILRNAADHGIESSEERINKGKNESGTITLKFMQKGHSIFVTCEDDGQGINYDKVREKLISEGVIQSHDIVTDKELSHYLMKPGFSTRDTVTSTSGRGVGMDVVHQSVFSYGGYIEINSLKNVGCKVEITLPVTMVSKHVLITRVAETLYAIPSNIVINAFASGSGEVRKIGEKLNFNFGDKNYSLHFLAQLLSEELNEINKEEFLSKKPGMIIRSELGEKAIFVDEVIGCKDIVLKKFGLFLPHLKGVQGAATLGDGSIIAVLEFNELLASGSQVVSFKNNKVNQSPQINEGLKKVLVVEDSLSTRRMLEQLVADSGYEVKSVIDGIEAVQLLKNWRPDLILSDLELPRLNGLELASHVRSRREISDIPIVMITSRYTEKHKESAKKAGVTAYLTKPFSEVEVLSHIENLTKDVA
ncbi:hybrid sensor histidine kinase/response regulator [Aliikangiella sp. IMCC44359]|uniref:hybrid sensor histidine kinase/response regulator n=1 Tax=Aliikangiella sp. IMCC44359 TaxID=3459125 RepID=UPI00403A922D